MKTNDIIITLCCLCAIGGCTAATAPQSEVSEVHGAIGTDTESTSTTPDGDATAPSDATMVELALDATDIGGEPLVGAQLCRAGMEAPRGYIAGDVAAFPRLTGRICGDAASDDGVASVLVTAESETLLELQAPGYGTYLLQHTSDDADYELALQLPSDAQIDAAYEAAGLSRDADKASMLVQTPVDGIEIALRAAYEESAQTLSPAIYLDAQGAPSDSAVAGGHALFAGIDEGPFEVSLTHDGTQCEVDSAFGWQMHDARSAWTKAGQTTYLGGIDCE